MTALHEILTRNQYKSILILFSLAALGFRLTKYLFQNLEVAMNIIFKKQSVLILILLFLSLISCGKDKNPTGNNGDNIVYPEAEEQNLDSKVLEELVNELGKGTYGDVHSLLIMRNDSFVLEKYFSPNPVSVRETLQDIQTVTQAITSTLVGIAIHQGKISGVDEKVYNFFPEYSHIFDQDSAKYTITLEHLLTMTAGFAWTEDIATYWWYGAEDELANMIWCTDGDWIKHVLSRPLFDDPGSRFVYNSGATMLLSGIINKACGLSLEEFAAEYLFKPLGISTWEWETCPKGNSTTFFHLDLRPLDMLKIGQLYLNKGRWNGVQVVPEEWINVSTERQVNDFDAGIPPIDACDHGYLWWRYSDNHPASSMLKINDVYFAFGWADQYIWIIPHLNMVVVSTASNSNPGTFKTYDIIWKYILRAVKD